MKKPRATSKTGTQENPSGQGSVKHSQDAGPDENKFKDARGPYSRAHQVNQANPLPMTADDQANQRAGSAMIIGVWVVLLGMLTWFAHQWYERSANPNRNPVTSVENGQSSIELAANSHGHYVASGKINGEDVVFLLDTGATSVSVPLAVAEKIGLTGEYPQQVRTANGTITVQATLLDSVTLGGLTLERVRGHINPGMQDDEVLLGMSFLRYFDMRTSNNRLTISTP